MYWANVPFEYYDFAGPNQWNERMVSFGQKRKRVNESTW